MSAHSQQTRRHPGNELLLAVLVAAMAAGAMACRPFSRRWRQRVAAGLRQEEPALLAQFRDWSKHCAAAGETQLPRLQRRFRYEIPTDGIVRAIPVG